MHLLLGQSFESMYGMNIYPRSPKAIKKNRFSPTFQPKLGEYDLISL